MQSTDLQNLILTIKMAALRAFVRIFLKDGNGIQRVLEDGMERIGLPDGTLTVKGPKKEDNASLPLSAADHTVAVHVLTDWLIRWIQEHAGRNKLAAIGHRIVHGGPKYSEPQRITPVMLEKLHEQSPYDTEHLPEEIMIAEALQQKFPDLPQVACFDTAFHRDLPRVARMLPIPRRYEAQGVRRYGFHGLSYTFLLQELARAAGTKAANGRIILAHLGNGASLAAVHKGKPVDTSMSFTPTAGVPMSTRSGDLDPGLVGYLSRLEHMSVKLGPTVWST